MKRRILLWLLRKVAAFEPDSAGEKLNDKERMLAYKEAYQIKGYGDLKRKIIRQHERAIAGRADGDTQIWFNRGIIFAHQMELQSMKSAYAAWQKDLATKERF